MPAITRPGLHASGRIIVLNGPSSSGKTSIAHALQRLMPTPLLHGSLDTFRAMEPPAYFDSATPAQAQLRVAALCRALNAAAAQYALHGLDVVLDHVLPPVGWQYLAEDFAALQVLLVAVRCAPAQLRAREMQRADRPEGLAQSQLAMHDARSYDFDIDTTEAPAASCASALAHWLALRPAPRAFAQLVATPQ